MTMMGVSVVCKTGQWKCRYRYFQGEVRGRGKTVVISRLPYNATAPRARATRGNLLSPIVIVRVSGLK